uniref:Uncharacterized protein n=1 Tax=Anguilla anguilla TaxID=7936 RepID=A0A0E9TQH2_ANGAN
MLARELIEKDVNLKKNSKVY